MKPQIVSWDIEGTLVPLDITKDKTVNETIIRGNCLELITQKPTLPLNPEVEEVMKKLRETGALQGIASDFAYQFGINLIASTNAREYIDPRLIFLANKYAWEAMVLDNQSYDKFLAQYAKPSPEMLHRTLARSREIQAYEISPQDCVYIGDAEKDHETASNAGWEFVHIDNLSAFAKCL
jgi:FMN phosphatase YigB (HAD superfamily)